MSVPRTGGSVCSSWPTATETDHRPVCPAEREEVEEAKREGRAEATYVQRLRVAADRWPTATGRDWKDGANAGENCQGGENGLLGRVVVNWPTATSGDTAVREPGWATPHTNCVTGAGSQGRDGGDNLQTQADAFPPSLPALPTAPDGSGSSSGGRGSRPLWRTPHAAQEIGMKPEDLTGELGSRMYREDGTNQTQDTQLQARIVVGDSAKRLNPHFVLWLMNFPLHWLSVGSMRSGHWETQLSRPKPPPPSASCGSVSDE